MSIRIDLLHNYLLMRRTIIPITNNHLTIQRIRHISNLPKMFKEQSDAAMTSIGSSKIVNDFTELYNEMERRKYNVRWITIGCAAAVVYIFYGLITDWLSDQAADVTSKYLENPKFKKDVIKFAEEAVNELVKSERVQKDITELLKDTVIKLTDDDTIRTKLTNMFIVIFKTNGIKEAGGELSEDVVNQLLNSPKYENIRQEAVKFVVDEMIQVIKNDELQKNVGIASWNAFKVWFGMTPNNANISVSDKV